MASFFKFGGQAKTKKEKEKEAKKKQKEKEKETQASWSDPGYEYGEIGEFEPMEENSFDELVEWETFDDPDYSTSTYGDLILSRKHVGGSWKGRAILEVDVSAAQMLDVFWDLPHRHKWDPLFSFMNNITELDEGTQLIHIASKKLPLVSRRDFLQRRKRRDCEEYSAAVFRPCPPDVVAPMPGSTRGEVTFSGMVCRPINARKCRLTVLTDTSFGMPIPTWIMNQLIPIFAKLYVGRLRNHLEALIQEFEDSKNIDESENPGSSVSSLQDVSSSSIEQ